MPRFRLSTKMRTYITDGDQHIADIKHNGAINCRRQNRLSAKRHWPVAVYRPGLRRVTKGQTDKHYTKCSFFYPLNHVQGNCRKISMTAESSTSFKLFWVLRVTRWEAAPDQTSWFLVLSTISTARVPSVL